MRHKGSISHINLERDKVVPILYRKAKTMVEWPADTMKICKKAATLPVSEFYISLDAAVEYVRKRYYYSRKKRFRSEYKQQLYEALYDRFLEIVEKDENINRSLPELVSMAISSPAPCSGLTPYKLYCTMLRLRKKGKI